VPSDVPFAAVAAGGFQTCALSRDGDPYCWGGSEFREAGGTGARVRTPTRVPGVPKLSMLAAGVWVTCGVTVSGDVVCWGRITYGGGASPPRTAPRAGAAYASVSVSQTHTCAITTDGRLLCWGSARGGALGTGMLPDTAADTAPRPVVSQERFASIAGLESAASPRWRCAGAITGSDSWERPP
jgi:alpha-tubulin suppressor-like RCC1 family protein